MISEAGRVSEAVSLSAHLVDEVEKQKSLNAGVVMVPIWATNNTEFSKKAIK